MHLLTAIYTLFSIIVVEAFPIIPANRALPEVFIEVTRALDGIQLGNCVDINATLPRYDTEPALPVPSHGLGLKYVALGRGTQNYTCSSNDESASPVAVGAVATLFDASCLASHNPTIFHELPSALGKVPADLLGLFAVLFGQMTSRSTKGLILGDHYFTNTNAPMFDLRIGGHKDWIQAKKGASVPAPSNPNNKGQDVPWLKLGFADGSSIQEVYRVHTSGGLPPSTCEGQKESFEIEYAAEYWFYG